MTETFAKPFHVPMRRVASLAAEAVDTPMTHNIPMIYFMNDITISSIND
jgi:hypothetical protein